MKTINELEQEAKQARDDMREVMLDEFGIGATLSDRILSLMIGAVQSNIAHNDAKQEVSGDGSGESSPEVGQKERDSDGWIVWGGGDCPVQSFEKVEVMFKGQTIENKIDFAGKLRWQYHSNPWTVFSRNIIAYRIIKGE